MIGYSAFGDDAKRQALIADVRAKGPIYTAWLTRASIEGDISSISNDYGLHPALARLLPALGSFGESDDALPFYEVLLDAIPTRADTGRLARETLLLAWTHPTYGQSRTVKQRAVYEACEAIVVLGRRSIDAPVDKQAWRAARARLAGARGEEESAEKVIDMMLSLAWDLEQAPGAAHDVMVTWISLVDSEADASDEDCFSDEENKAFRAAIDRINEEAMQGLTDQQPGEDFSYDDFLAEVDKHWAADPVAYGLKSRSVARRARTNAKMAQWRAAIHSDLLERAKMLPREPEPSRRGAKYEDSADQLQT